MSDTPIRDISDTAAWVAVYRARESERADPVFRDPFARRLAGERGEAIVAGLKAARRYTWSYTARTHSFDAFVAREVAAGADMVVNLAAGLDARPYRLDLPPALQWVEVDLPALVAYKEEVLSGEKPVCALERVKLDLSDAAARRALLAELGRRARRILVLSEGLIVYLTEEEARGLARDLASPPYERWAIDLVTPRLLRMLQKQVGTALSEAGAPLRFAPPGGAAFFAEAGWRALEVHSMLHTAARLRRLPLLMRPFALFPDTRGTKPNQPWGGTVLLGRSGESPP